MAQDWQFFIFFLEKTTTFKAKQEDFFYYYYKKSKFLQFRPFMIKNGFGKSSESDEFSISGIFPR